MSVSDKVIGVVSEQMEAEVTEETVVTGVDELQRVELLWAVEEEFGLKISDEDFGALETVGCLVRYVDGALGGTAN